MNISVPMPNSENAQVRRPTLAEAAGPVRLWLTRFFGRRIGDPAEIEDMVQDVFARIVARDSVEPVEHLNGYVLKTASSVMADRARRRSSRADRLHVAFDADLHGEASIDPERVLGGKEDLHAATAALLSLPERTRTVFLLHRLEGHKYRDIAAHIGISVSAVEKHMVRAITHLSLAMEKRHGS
jgi:RNA polymerase sigma factor (sigma-70 family)